MKEIAPTLSCFLVAALLWGCGTDTKAPPITGKPRPNWNAMSQEEKTAMIQRQPIPEAEKQKEIGMIKDGKM